MFLPVPFWGSGFSNHCSNAAFTCHIVWPACRYLCIQILETKRSSVEYRLVFAIVNARLKGVPAMAENFSYTLAALPHFICHHIVATYYCQWLFLWYHENIACIENEVTRVRWLFRHSVELDILHSSMVLTDTVFFYIFLSVMDILLFWDM
jgi:hypothetical protein